MSARLPNGWLLSTVLLLIVTVSLAQNPTPQPLQPASESSFGPPPYYGYGGAWGGGGGGWGGYGWGGLGAGSTPMGSYLSGMASAIRAQGQYNLMTSEAAINAEEAARRNIENRQRWTNTYFEMRRINQAYQQSQRGPQRTQEDWVRLAQVGVPARINSSELDPVTGAINWPIALKTPTFDKDRNSLDHLFAERATMHGAIGINAHNQIRTTIDGMLETLKSQIREIDTRLYLNARTFLTGLSREADFPTSAYTMATSEQTSHTPPAVPPPPRPGN